LLSNNSISTIFTLICIHNQELSCVSFLNISKEERIQLAFNWYKQSKEEEIKRVADLYKSKYPNFPQKLYDAMYAYEVEITD
jgi:hypothetical protein